MLNGGTDRRFSVSFYHFQREVIAAFTYCTCIDRSVQWQSTFTFYQTVRTIVVIGVTCSKLRNTYFFMYTLHLKYSIVYIWHAAPILRGAMCELNISRLCSFEDYLYFVWKNILIDIGFQYCLLMYWICVIFNALSNWAGSRVDPRV